MCKPIGLGWTLCMSKSHERMHDPGTVDVIGTEAGGGWWLRASRAADHASLDTCIMPSRNDKN